MRYVIGFLVTIGLIILVFILVLKGFSGDGSKSSTQTELVSYANSAVEMRLTVDGPIVADAEHNAYRITVGRDETRIETFKGYESTLIQVQRYDNNPVSYANFLRALDFASFSKGVTNTEAKDERGMCAAGSRYLMEIINGSSRVQRFWSSSCRGQGTFKGKVPEVLRLFRVQVPPKDMSKFTGNLNL